MDCEAAWKLNFMVMKIGIIKEAGIDVYRVNRT